MHFIEDLKQSNTGKASPTPILISDVLDWVLTRLNPVDSIFDPVRAVIPS
jgi:hypothetical protein